MNLEFLSPIEDIAVAHTAFLSELSLGKTIRMHTKKSGLPDLDGVQIALIGVPESRNSVDNASAAKGIEQVRKFLYQMYPGNWYLKIADLGNILPGKTVEDTYAALKELVGFLCKSKITPVIIGGSQDLSYAQYRGYDELVQGVNMVVVDSRFDLGTYEGNMNAQNYIHKIVLEKPCNLFSFSNIGYQTFFNSQEEIDLIDKLNFDAHRLGEVTKDITSIEPVMRDADLVSIDMGVVRMSEAPGNANAGPNGLFGDQICAVARYAGISNKNTSFGIYEYNAKFDEKNQTAHLIAQMVWYYMEGYNFRIEENPFVSINEYQKFIVLLEDDTINFYKSNKSERWWMEIEYFYNKLKKSTLIPCTYQDYLTANNQVFPERWVKTFRKLS